MSLSSCWQCELDIAHVCYAGMPNARWGWGDEAIAALEGAQRHGFMLTADPTCQVVERQLQPSHNMNETDRSLRATRRPRSSAKPLAVKQTTAKHAPAKKRRPR